MEESNPTLDTERRLPQSAPEGGWGWVIVFASFMCNVIVDGIIYSFGIFMIEFMTEFGESSSKVSMVGSLLIGMYLITGPIVGALSNKFGCRPVAIAGSVLGAASFALAPFSPNVNVLIVIYGVMGGMGFGLIYIPAVVSVAPYFRRKLALTTGIAVSGSGVGTFIFAPFSRYLLDTYDWRTALYVFAGIILTSGIFGLLMKPLGTESRYTRETLHENERSEALVEQDERHPKGYIHQLADVGASRSSLQAIYYHQVPFTTNPELRNPTVIGLEDFDKVDRESLVPRDSTVDELTDAPQSAASTTPVMDESGNQLNGYASVPTQPGVAPSFRQRFLHDVLDISLLRKPAFVLISLGNVFTMIGYFIPFVFIVDRAKYIEISESKAAFLLSVIGITNTVGRILSGLLADRPWGNPVVMISVGILLSGVVTIVAPLFNSHLTMVVYAACFGFFISAFVALSTPLLVHFFGKDRLNIAFGYLTLVRGICIVIGPPIAGVISDSTKSVPFYLSGGLMVVGAALHFLLLLKFIKPYTPLDQEQEITIAETVGEDDDVAPALSKSVLH